MFSVHWYYGLVHDATIQDKVTYSPTIRQHTHLAVVATIRAGWFLLLVSDCVMTFHVIGAIFSFVLFFFFFIPSSHSQQQLMGFKVFHSKDAPHEARYIDMVL